MADVSIGSFITYIAALNTLSEKYSKLHSVTDMVVQNRRVMEYLRHPDYDNDDWTRTIGNVSDPAFIAYVDSNKQAIAPVDGGAPTKLVPIPEFEAPSSVGPVHARTIHWAATLNGVFVLGMPTAINTIGHGDATGWAGDLITFYAEWLRDDPGLQNGATYCKAHLFHDNTTYKMQDLIEDTDAFNIGMKLRDVPTLSIADAVKQYYSGADVQTKKRYESFYTRRYGGPPFSSTDFPPNINTTSADVVVKTAIAILTQISDPLLVAGRKYQIWKIRDNRGAGTSKDFVNATISKIMFGPGPDGPDSDAIVAFCTAYKDALLSLCGKEALGLPVVP